MTAPGFWYVYGPVPSRRLGRSLGIDLAPLNTCTYDCVYCQLGRTTNKTVERRAYITAEVVLAELRHKLVSDPLPPDHIGIAVSGEPSLNSDVGRVIEGIKDTTSVAIAVPCDFRSGIED